MISLLYVDDEPGLLELGKLFLESAGGFEVSTALSGDEGLGQLAQHDFDAIVSDFQMPGMDGIEFLKKVRKSFGTIPFVLFTGRGREEVVIEAINNGVDFYLQKGGDPKSQFAELAHKVRQSVSRRKAEIALSDSEKRLADIINFLPDATFAIDTKGVVIAWNRAMELMTGFRAEDVLGKGDYEYALPFYHERRPLLINLVLDNDPAIGERYPFVKKDGRNLFSEITIPHFNDGRGAALWFTASLLYDRKGEVVGAIESIREITERKRAEEARNESERRFRELADLLPQGIYESDTEGRMTYVNRLALEMFGYTAEDVDAGLNALNVITPEDRSRAAAIFSQMVETGTRSRESAEYRAVRKDGSTFPVSIHSTPVYHHDRIIGIRGVIIDITTQKKAEETLLSAHQEYTNLLEQIQDVYYRSDSEGRLVRASRSWATLLGYNDVSECIGRSIADDFYFNPPDRIRVLAEIAKNGKVTGYEVILKKKDGTPVPVEISSHPYFDPAGIFMGIEGTFRDMTSRKKAEEELRAANEQLVASDEELRAQYDELALGEKRARMSESRLRYMLGFDEYTKKSERELLGYAIEGAGVVTDSPLGYLAFLNEDESELSMYAWSKSAMAECLMRTKPIVYKTEKTGLWGEAVRQRRPVITNDYTAPNPAKKGYPEGHPHIIRHMNVPVIDDNHIVLVAGVANKPTDYVENDVSELQLLVQGLWNILKRRHAEETRNESEAKYRNIIDHAPSGMHFYELKPDGSLVFTGSNPGADRILGVVHSQFIGKTIEEAFPALVGTEVPVQYRRIAADGGTWQKDQVTYDGEALHGAYTVTAFQTSPGAVVASFMDITDRKRAEEALFNSQQMLQAVLDSIPQRVFWKDRNSVFLGCNKPLALDAGYTDPADMIGKTDYDHASHATADLYRTDDRRVMETGQPRINFEEPQIRSDGSHAWLRTTKIPLRNKKGAIIGVLGTYEDITDRKKADAALRESETKFQAVIDQSFEFIGLMETDGTLVVANRSALEFAGIPESAVINRPFWETAWWSHSEEAREKLRDSIHRAASGETVRFETPLTAVDGNTKYFDFSVKPVMDGTGKIRYLIPEARDITDRRRTEQALRESEEKYRTLVETNRDIIYSLSTDGTILFVSPQAIAQLGYLPEEMVGQNLTGFIHPDDIGMLKSHIQKNSVPGSRVDSDRFRVRRKDGIYRWFEDTTIYTTDRQKRSIVTGTIRDITEEKAAYDALGESEGRYRSLVELSPDAVVVHHEGKILYANPAALRLAGAEKEEDIIGREVISFIHPDDRAMALEDFRQLYEEGKIIPLKEERLVRINGDPYTVEVIASPIQYQGRLSVLAVFRDITERKRAEAALCESEEKYRSLVENIPFGITLIDADHRIVISNAAQGQMFHTDSGLWTGRYCYREFEKRDAVCTHCPGTRAMATGVRHEVETEGVRDDGTRFNARIHAIPLLDNEGKGTRFIEVVEDITERKTAEDALRQNEAKYRALVETTGTGFVILDHEGRVLDANPEYIRMTGHTRLEDISGRNVTEWTAAHEQDRNADAVRQCIRDGFIRNFEIDYTDNSGAITPVEINAKVVQSEGAVHILTLCRDITERKRVENELLRLKISTDRSSDEVFWMDFAGNILYVNDAACQVTGYSREEFLKMKIFELDPDVRPNTWDASVTDLRERKTQFITTRHRRKDGVIIDVEIVAVYVNQYDQEYSFAYVRDITDRKRADDTLRETSRKYAELFELGGEAIFLIDNETGALLEANAAACEMYGYQRDLLLTMKNTDLSAEKEETKKVTTETPPGVVRVPIRYHRRKDGTVFPVEIMGRFFVWDGRPVHIAAIRDITEKNRTEAAIREANRKLNLLNSITRHDIRNQLTVAQGYTQLAALSKPDPVITDFLARITAAIETIQRQIEFTKTYQELGVHAPAWFRIVDVVRRVRPGKTALHTTCNTVEIFADPMIDMVFFNLFDNAMKYGETVTAVTVGCERRGNTLVIIFADNGCGIEPGEKQKIFEKGYGKNTGLGLFLVREILAITDITISETGTPGKGAVFEIVVPQGAYRNAE